MSSYRRTYHTAYAVWTFRCVNNTICTIFSSALVTEIKANVRCNHDFYPGYLHVTWIFGIDVGRLCSGGATYRKMNRR